MAIKLRSTLYIEIEPQWFFKHLLYFLQGVKHECPDLRDCVFGPESDLVLQVLNERSANLMPENDPALQNWPDVHKAFFKSQGVEAS